MKRFHLALVCLVALVAASGGSELLQARGPAGKDARSGRITEIKQVKGGGRVATAVLEGSAQGPAGSTIYGGTSKEIRPAMRVRLTVLLGTSVFSAPVGTVVEVSADGGTILFSVDEDEMETVLEEPTSGQKALVADLFRVGAEISVI